MPLALVGGLVRSMARQINPHLFGDSVTSNTVLENFNSLGPINFFDEPQLDSPQVSELSGKIDKLNFEFEEWKKAVSLRSEKTIQKLKSVEDRMGQLVREINERQAYILTRVKDKQLGEMKIEGLLERHNQIVQSFELRLAQAQRVIENQSLQLNKQQALIDESRRQIEKLKKL